MKNVTQKVTRETTREVLSDFFFLAPRRLPMPDFVVVVFMFVSSFIDANRLCVAFCFTNAARFAVDVNNHLLVLALNLWMCGIS